MTYFSVELIVFSGLLLLAIPPAPLLHRHSIIILEIVGPQTRFIRGTQPDLSSQAQNPSHMLLSLLAEPKQDIFLRFRGLHCVDPHQVVVACCTGFLQKHQSDAPSRI